MSHPSFFPPSDDLNLNDSTIKGTEIKNNSTTTKLLHQNSFGTRAPAWFTVDAGLALREEESKIKFFELNVNDQSKVSN